ncbi:MAG: Fic family protein [Pseudomonadota bacterium]
MTTPHEKLAVSLEILRSFQKRGAVALRSRELTRTHRERLIRNGFLKEIIKGWYLIARPDEVAGESTAWYASFWDFCAVYLRQRFGTDYCLSPEQSLLLHVGNMTVPDQLLVRSPKARNRATALLHDTSLLDVRAVLPAEGQFVEKSGLRLFSVSAGLVSCGPSFFQQHTIDARAVLATIGDASEVLAPLLEGGRSTVAGRLAGALRNIGRNRAADDIVKTMRTAGYDVRESDPFETSILSVPAAPARSPYASRIRLMWQQMREVIIDAFPAAPDRPVDIEAYMKTTDDNYVKDAYHSLSIEGYRVSPELIERVRSGQWDPEEGTDDRRMRNALAARGYWQAYQSVRHSVRKVLEGANPGTVCEEGHRDWYREMFGPEVAAGLIKPADLAGYRNGQVFIRRSRHVPPRYEAVRDCMPAFFDQLGEEAEPSVRVVLGHFIFVYIHPYMDGNGRMGRFIMNLMLAAGGHPWTVIPVEKRDDYMDALESASVTQDILPFARFIARLLEVPTPHGVAT